MQTESSVMWQQLDHHFGILEENVKLIYKVLPCKIMFVSNFLHSKALTNTRQVCTSLNTFDGNSK